MFFFSSRRRHTRCALVTGVQTCALPISMLAVVLLLTTPTILVQFTPFRIDHHGWQIWMAAVALCGALAARCLRGGDTAGLALAVWLQISSEALPYAALLAGAFALRSWFGRRAVAGTPPYAAPPGGCGPP